MCVKSLVSMKKTEMKGVEKRSEIIYNTVVLKIKGEEFQLLTPNRGKFLPEFSERA